MLFHWHFDGDTPSQVLDGFKLSEPSARVFDALAGRVGASLAGRNTYDDSGWIQGAALSALKQRAMLRELRPKAGKSPWRALYRQVGAPFVIAAIGPEAKKDKRGFDKACQYAIERLAVGDHVIPQLGP